MTSYKIGLGIKADTKSSEAILVTGMTYLVRRIRYQYMFCHAYLLITYYQYYNPQIFILTTYWI